ncbi:MAG: MoaD/ThiS family protein [bacterium]
MGKVKLKLHSWLNAYLPKDKRHHFLELQVKGITVEDLISQLGLPEEEVMFITVNQKRVTRTYRINPGELIELFPRVGGG